MLALMAEGRSNSAIAERLFMSLKTVETHVRRIFTKLDLEPAGDDHRRVLAVLRYLRARDTEPPGAHAIPRATIGAMAFALTVTLLIVAYGNLGTWLRPDAVYVPLNLTVAGGLIWAARARGFGWTEIGIARASIAPGVRWGLAAVAVTATAFGLGLAFEPTREVLADGRYAGLTGGGLAYRATLRVPFGTVLLEEVAFRGVLLAAWLRVTTTARAAWVVSVAFGVWHVAAALELLRANVDVGVGLTVLAVGASVLGTIVGGLFFVWLRFRARGLLAPTLVHASFNVIGTAAAYTAHRLI